MTVPTTPTGKRMRAAPHGWNGEVIIAIEQEAAAAERERLEAEGWHAPEPDCGPIKALPHMHSYVWSSGNTLARNPPVGTPCDCGHRYEAPSDD